MPSALLHHSDLGGGVLQLMVGGNPTSWMGPTSDGLGNGIVGVYGSGHLLGEFFSQGSGIQSSARIVLRGGAFVGVANWTARLADHFGFFTEGSILYSHHMGRLHLRAVRLGGDTKSIVRLGYQDGNPFVGELRLYDPDGEKVIIRPREGAGWVSLYCRHEGELRQTVDLGAAPASWPRRGRLFLLDAGSERVRLGVDESSRGALTLRDEAARSRVSAGVDSAGAYVEVRDGEQFVRLRARGYERPPGKELPIEDQFVVRDPEDPTRSIHYCVLEGPEVGMYVRGTAPLSRGKATVELPGHFARLASEQGLTAHLTPRSARSRGVAAVSLKPARLVIQELGRGRGSYQVDYLVHGVYRGREGFQPVRPTVRRDTDSGIQRGPQQDAAAPDSGLRRTSSPAELAVGPGRAGSAPAEG